MVMRKWLKSQAWFIGSVAAALVALMVYQTVKINPISGEKIGVVLMHGKGGTLKYVSSLGSALNGAGVLVETPLMPWSRDRIYDKGYEESMAEIDTYVARLKAAGAKRIVVAGHSIGANAALGYGARREGLSGVILLAYGHVPGIPGFARKLFESTHRAQTMISAGKGEESAIFKDSGGGNSTATSSANDLFSWFDPRGPAIISKNARKVKPNTPVLCIDGSSDPRQRCNMIMFRLPKNPMNRDMMVNAGHLGTPSSSVKEVIDWLRTLK